MNVTISGHNMNNGKALEAYVSEKMNQNVKKYFKNAVKTDIIFTKEKNQYKTQIVVNEGTGHHAVVAADCTAEDVYSSFEQATTKLVAQLRKHKGKLRGHHRKEGVKIKYDDELKVS